MKDTTTKIEGCMEITTETEEKTMKTTDYTSKELIKEINRSKRYLKQANKSDKVIFDDWFISISANNSVVLVLPYQILRNSFDNDSNVEIQKYETIL